MVPVWAAVLIGVVVGVALALTVISVIGAMELPVIPKDRPPAKETKP